MNDLSTAFVLLPTFFCSYYVVKSYLKWNIKFILFICASYLLVTIPLLHALQNAAGMRDNRALLPFLAAFFGIYYISTSLPLGRSLVIYLWSSVFMSFPSNAAFIVNALLHDEHLNIGPDIVMIQAIISLAICAGVYIAVNLWDVRVLSPIHAPESIWYSWMSIPILFLAMNIAMIPPEYNSVQTLRIFHLFALFTVCLLLLYIYLTGIFYSFMLEYIHVRDFEEASHIHEIQDLQFRNLQEQMQRDSRARHDFKHTLRILTRLAASENWEELKQYLSNYAENADNIIVKNYCLNPALNAVLNYYSEKSEENGISTELQVDLPDVLPMDDIELCSMLGNIMENAINACMRLPADLRRLSVSLQVKNDINLYIVSTNSYDGSLSENDGIYTSSKPGHKGIGLRSIGETVDKYNGVMRIEADDREFRLDIVMKINNAVSA